MAARGNRQLQSFPPEENTASPTVTFTNLLDEAARAECGRNITIRNWTTVKNGIEKLKRSVSIKVLRRDEKPRQVGMSVVDISTKEYTNHATEDGKDPTDRDTTKAMVKRLVAKKGRNYQFTSTQGVKWDVGPEVGFKILAMGMGGGSIGLGRGSDGLGEDYGTDKSKPEKMKDFLKESLGYEYNQEETVCVPPGKKVHLTIIAYTVQYRQNYTLEFSVPKYGSVYVSYRKPCCCGLCSCMCCLGSCLCGLCSSLCCLCKCEGSRHIPYSRIVSRLPNFREDGRNAYFTQEGFLSWIGESFEVDKKETSLYAS